MGITDDLAKPIRQLQRSIELSVADPRNQALISYPLSTLSVIIVLARMSAVKYDCGSAFFMRRIKRSSKSISTGSEMKVRQRRLYAGYKAFLTANMYLNISRSISLTVV